MLFAVAQVGIIHTQSQNIIVTNHANSSRCVSFRRTYKNVNGLSYLQNMPNLHVSCFDCIFGFGYIAKLPQLMMYSIGICRQDIKKRKSK
jgi:hypothetical protein